MAQEGKRIMGFDPGTNMMGYGCIEVKSQKIALLGKGVINLQNTSEAFKKLSKIYESCSTLLKQFDPEEVAIEAPFFGKNVQSMLKLGRAQGVAIAAVVSLGKPVSEYSPRSIKQAITGNGNASKIQVSGMLNHLISTGEVDNKDLDASDAIATAICHHFQTKNGSLTNKKTTSWEQFIKENPDKLG